MAMLSGYGFYGNFYRFSDMKTRLSDDTSAIFALHFHYRLKKVSIFNYGTLIWQDNGARVGYCAGWLRLIAALFPAVVLFTRCCSQMTPIFNSDAMRYNIITCNGFYANVKKVVVK